MPKYLVHGNYVGDGIGGLLAEGGTSRSAAVNNLVESVGGYVESIYYAFGDTDVFVIVDMPDHASMTAVALTVASTGRITIKTTVLMSPEEIDDAVRLSPNYRPPGQ